MIKRRVNIQASFVKDGETHSFLNFTFYFFNTPYCSCVLYHLHADT